MVLWTIFRQVVCRLNQAARNCRSVRGWLKKDMEVEPNPAENGKDGASESLLGMVIDGKFRIDELVGTGAMGSVFRATHLQLQQTRALKVLHRWLMSDAKACKRFLHEARAINSLDHPNVVKVYACGQTADAVYIAMEFLSGESLSEVLKRKGRLPVEEAVAIVTDAAKGLQHAHDKGVLHRDIKPSNIMLSSTDGGATIVQVVDFGVAKILQSESGSGASQSLTTTGASIGTPYYMSPEQCCGDVLDARSDIYSLGCVLFEAVSATLPVDGDSVYAAMYAHMQGQISSLPEDVPEWLRAIIFTCLETNRDQRFQSMQELIVALEKRTAAAAFTVKRKVGSQKQRIHTRLKLVLGAFFVVGAAAIVFSMNHFSPTPANTEATRAAVELRISQLSVLLTSRDFVLTKRQDAYEYAHLTRELADSIREKLTLIDQKDRNPQDVSDLIKAYEKAAEFAVTLGEKFACKLQIAKIPYLSRSEVALKNIDAVDFAITAAQQTMQSYKKSALIWLDRAQTTASEFPLPQSHGLIGQYYGRLLTIGEIYFSAGEADKAEIAWTRALECANQYWVNTGYQANALANLARAYRLQGRAKEADASERQAIGIALNRADATKDDANDALEQRHLRDVFVHVGRAELGKHNFARGVQYSKESLRIAQKYFPTDLTLIADSRINLGSAYDVTLDQKAGLAEFELAMQTFKTLGASAEVRAAQVYRILGDHYVMFGLDPTKVIEYSRKGEALAAKHAKEGGAYYVYANRLIRARAWQIMGKLDEAATVVLKSIADPQIDPNNKTEAYYVLGMIREAQNRRTESLQAYKEELRMRIAGNRPADEVSMTALRVAIAAEVLQNEAERQEYWKLAMDYALKANESCLKEVQRRAPKK